MDGKYINFAHFTLSKPNLPLQIVVHKHLQGFTGFFCSFEERFFTMEIALTIIFILGYLLISLEGTIHINKAATALITGVACWTVYIMLEQEPGPINSELSHHLGSISEILLFLLGAMTIVELMDTHDGFLIITERIGTTNKTRLLVIISFITFFLSALLDNLTTTIVMVSLCRKMISDKNDRLVMAGMIIIAANAGGAWSPMGDVTSTMLWVNGQVTAMELVKQLFLPSLICLLVPLLIMSFSFKGQITKPAALVEDENSKTSVRERQIVFFLGMGLLVMVPAFKTITHLPPYMAMLGALGILWVATEILHKRKSSEDKNFLSVTYAVRKIDTPSILFFFGILATVACLESTGMLQHLSFWLDEKLGNVNLVVMTTGVLSAIVDNVPLVAATQGMYDLSVYPSDSYIWHFIAYSAGTGGSMLIIGSAAGVAAMGLETIDFGWYLKKISWVALAGFLAGAFFYILQHKFLF